MSTLAWIGVGAYSLLGLGLLRPVAGHCAWWQVEHWWEHQSQPDGVDWLLAGLAALIFGALWPLFLASALVCALLGHLWTRRPAVLDAPAIGAERRNLQKRQAERIAELEKELGL